MRLFRRDFLKKLAGAVVAAPALPRRASALDYPTRPPRIVAGFAAGGGVEKVTMIRPLRRDSPAFPSALVPEPPDQSGDEAVGIGFVIKDVG